MSEITLTNWLGSKFARRLDFVAGLAAFLLLCRVASEESLNFVFWVIGGVALLLLMTIRWPYGCLFVLVGMSAMPRFFVELFGWKARPEHFAAVIVSMAVGVWLLVDKRSVKLEKLDYWILAYVVVNFVSSAFGSTAPYTTLRWSLQNSLAILPYFLIRMMVSDLETLKKAFRILLGVGVVESTYGIVCFVTHHMFGSMFGMDMQYMGDVAAPYGSMYEPNLFGAYTGCCAAMCLALYLMGGHRLRYMMCFLIASLAAVVSLSRAALVALVISCALVFWQARGTRNKNWGRTATVVLAFGLILAVAVTAVGGILQERFSDLFNQGLADETTITRFIIIQEAAQEVPNHLLLGSGTASFNLSFDWGSYMPIWAGSSAWIVNAPLRILHDTGLTGLTAVLGFFFTVGWKIRQRVRARSSRIPMLIGLSAGALLYGVTFQVTDGSVLAFFWVHLGFLASAAMVTDGPISYSTAGAREPERAG